MSTAAATNTSMHMIRCRSATSGVTLSRRKLAGKFKKLVYGLVNSPSVGQKLTDELKPTDGFSS